MQSGHYRKRICRLQRGHAPGQAPVAAQFQTMRPLPELVSAAIWRAWQSAPTRKTRASHLQEAESLRWTSRSATPRTEEENPGKHAVVPESDIRKRSNHANAL